MNNSPKTSPSPWPHLVLLLALTLICTSIITAQRKLAKKQREEFAPRDYSQLDYSYGGLWVHQNGKPLRVDSQGNPIAKKSGAKPLFLQTRLVETEQTTMPKLIRAIVGPFTQGLLEYNDLAKHIAGKGGETRWFKGGFTGVLLHRWWSDDTNKLAFSPDCLCLVGLLTKQDICAEEVQVHWASKDGGFGHLLRVSHFNRARVEQGAPLLATAELIVAEAPYSIPNAPGGGDCSRVARAVEYHPRRRDKPARIREHFVLQQDKYEALADSGGIHLSNSVHLITEITATKSGKLEFRIFTAKGDQTNNWATDHIFCAPHQDRPTLAEQEALPYRYRWERPGFVAKSGPRRGAKVLKAPLFWINPNGKWNGAMPKAPRDLGIDKEARWTPRVKGKKRDIFPINGPTRFSGGKPVIYACGKTISTSRIQKFWADELARTKDKPDENARIKATLKWWLQFIVELPHREKESPSGKGKTLLKQWGKLTG